MCERLFHLLIGRAFIVIMGTPITHSGYLRSPGAGTTIDSPPGISVNDLSCPDYGKYWSIPPVAGLGPDGITRVFALSAPMTRT